MARIEHGHQTSDFRTLRVETPLVTVIPLILATATGMDASHDFLVAAGRLPRPFDSAVETLQVQDAYLAEPYLVRTIPLGRLEAGPHRAVWDGLNDQGKPVTETRILYPLEASYRPKWRGRRYSTLWTLEESFPHNAPGSGAAPSEAFELELTVWNYYRHAIRGLLPPRLPKGWHASQDRIPFAVPPGEHHRQVINVTVPAHTQPGVYEVGGQTQYQDREVIELHAGRVKVGAE
jgi:hypothetical protein